MSFLPKRSPSFGKIGLLLHHNQYSVISPSIMSTHTQQVTSRPRVLIEPEIVDDSEPERIEIQKTLKKRPRTSVENLQSPSIINLKHVNRIPVIEISDSDSQSAVSTSKHTRIQHLDSRTQDQVRSTNSDDRTLFGPKPSSVGTSQLSAAMHSPSQENEPSKGSSKLNLDRFMFKNSRMPRNLQVSTEPVPSTSSAMPNSDTKGLKQKRLPMDLSASDVGKISRCVCCNVQWTARKSGAQKMTHIQTCAKKHALDAGTVNLLIQKEISPEQPFVKKTFFEDVLVDAAPKQKVKRRKKEESSLKTVSISRDSILARAQGILSTSTVDCKYQNGSTFAGSTQGRRELPSTQAFDCSGLAQMQDLERNTFSLDDRCPYISDDNSDQGGSEAQPAFLASCLASRPLKVFGDCEPDHQDTRSGGPSFGDESGVETNYTLNPKHLFSSLIEGRGLPSSSVPRTPTPDSSPKLLSVLTNLTIHSPTPTLKSKKASKALALDVSSHIDEPTLSSNRVAPKKKKGPSKKTTSKITHQFDEKWQLHLRRNIILDRDLHLRILRYEPIHFEVFLEIAIRYAPPSGKLKRHLRTFLDNQAIIFYGETTRRQG